MIQQVAIRAALVTAPRYPRVVASNRDKVIDRRGTNTLNKANGQAIRHESEVGGLKSQRKKKISSKIH